MKGRGMHYKGIEVPILEQVDYPRLDDLNVHDTVEEALICALHVAQKSLEMHRNNHERFKNSNDAHVREDAQFALAASGNASMQRYTIVQMISYIYGPLYAYYIIDKVLQRVNIDLMQKTLRVEL